jgi:hypothetical protein
MWQEERVSGSGDIGALLDGENVAVLSRIARFRITTAAQARVLFPEYEGTSIQNVRARLRRLVEIEVLEAQPVRPQRGAAAEYLFRLSGVGLRMLGREEERSVLAVRPKQHILEYLLFRNDVYARALAAGWKLASPTVSPPERIPAYLDAFNDWATRAKSAEVDALRAAGREWDVRMAEGQLERLPKFVPKELTFEFLYRLGADRRVAELVLLVVDDPRRAVSRGNRPFVAGARFQIDDLPLEVPPGLKIAVCARLAPGPNPDGRRRKWRRQILEKYGREGIFDGEVEAILQPQPRIR